MTRLFAEKLRHIRQTRKITQVHLAKQLGLASHAHVANLEAGRDVPSLELVLRISEVLGISIDYLLRDTLPTASVSDAHMRISTDRTAPSFGARLRALRRQHNLSQRELAGRLGLASRAYIGALESGGKLPSLDLLVQLADFFGVTADELIGEVQIKSADG
jgi:transcriptional regulator with XRE-family HTH domain